MPATVAADRTMDWSSMMSAPHLAVVALPVMALLSRRSSFASTSSLSPQASPVLRDQASSHWGDSFVLDDDEPAAPSRAAAVISAAYNACTAVFDLKARLTAQATMLSEAQDEMAVEDEGDEDDWYAGERAARTKASLTKQLNEKLMDLEPIHAQPIHVI